MYIKDTNNINSGKKVRILLEINNDNDARQGRIKKKAAM